MFGGFKSPFVATPTQNIMSQGNAPMLMPAAGAYMSPLVEVAAQDAGFIEYNDRPRITEKAEVGQFQELVNAWITAAAKIPMLVQLNATEAADTAMFA
ncbi:MAG: hypothetical protein C5B60_06890 [Chloroflexi bacterium]|nr:MAG: hypothetical protein C5B60_06890 [Chloroflexota bacterium]